MLPHIGYYDADKSPFYTPHKPCKWCRRLWWWLRLGAPAALGWLVIFRWILS